MNVEIVKRFLNKHSKIIKADNFAVYGKIIAIEYDCAIIVSNTKTSAIVLDQIVEITPIDEEKKK